MKAMNDSAIVVDFELRFIKDGELQLTATIHNGLDRDLCDWNLQFDLPKSIAAGEGTVLRSQVGSHVTLAPTEGGVLSAGASVDLSCFGAAGMIQRLSDLPWGLYLSCVGQAGQREFLPAVTGEHNLAAIVSGEVIPYTYGTVAVPAASTGHQSEAGASAGAITSAESGTVGIVPRPLQTHWGEGHFSCGALLEYSGDPEAEAAASWLAGQLPLELRRSDIGEGGLHFESDPALASEAYRLRVASDSITVWAAAEAGFFYAAVSLVQLAYVAEDGIRLPCVAVEDEPRFGFRGLMLDCSRQFHSVETVLKTLDLMALFKLNWFHWHLTDDEGWRVEIQAFPQLTERGAWRGEEELLEPQFGSGPGRYGGYYSREEVRAVVAYASARQIQVIPEIDIPGHSRAAIKSCPELLVEEGDESRYCGAQLYTDNVLNPALPGTYQFLHTVLDEICEMFPGPWIHLGVDEVPEGVWEQSPVCRQFMKKLGYDSPQELQGHLLRDLQEHLAEHGRELMGWEEAVHGDKLDHSATVHAWSGIPVGTGLANAGYRVVACPAPFLYLDLAWDASASEPGYYWAGTSDLQTCYAYEPYADDLSEEGKSRLLGVQAVLWSELLASPAQLEYMMFPRLLAVAETAWTSRQGKDWRDFSARLPRQMAMLEQRGVNHRALDE